MAERRRRRTAYENEGKTPVVKQKNENSKGLSMGTIGIIISAVMLVTMIVFDVLLAKVKILETKHLVLIIIGLLLLIGIYCLVLIFSKKKSRFIVAAVTLGVIFLALIYGISVCSKFLNAMDNITDNTKELVNISVYVKTEDTAKEFSDIKGDRFGILKTLDRESTDKTIEEINKEIKGTINVSEYDGIIELIEALLNGDIRSMIVNPEYLDIVYDLDQYEGLKDSIRELSNYSIETDTKENSGKTEPVDTNREVITLYISGIDSRDGLVAKSRSDVNIIATINLKTRQVSLVSTPRDYFVPLSISGGKRDKLTHAGIYGVNVSVETLEMLYGIDIDYYFRVNFTGFERIVDSLGGVEVYSAYAFTSYHHRFKFTKGYNKVNGAQALDFARERYAFKTGDVQRGKNQMELIKAILKKAMSKEILTKYGQVLDSLKGAFETSLPYELIAEIAKGQVYNQGDWNIVSYTVTGTGAHDKPYSLSTNAYVMIPNMDTVAKAQEMMRQCRDGETLTDPNAQ